MKQSSRTWQHRAFVLALLVLTWFCWCPLGYGAYGPVRPFFGIPSWAVLAWTFAACLFLLEWICLFHTQLAINDEQLPEVISQLETLDIDHPAAAELTPVKEGE